VPPRASLSAQARRARSPPDDRHRCRPLVPYRAPRQLTPGEPWVDAGSGTAGHLPTRRTAPGIDRMGPVADDQRGQGPAGKGVAAARGGRDGDATSASCPPGQRGVGWMERPARHGHAPVRIAFSTPGGGACASRADGTRAATAPRTCAAVRERMTPPSRAHGYGNRRTPSRRRTPGEPAVPGRWPRAPEPALDDARAMGVVKPRLLPLRLAAATHVMRVAAWLAHRPRARTRPAALAALAAAAAEPS
jgi:hypothetical protein